MQTMDIRYLEEALANNYYLSTYFREYLFTKIKLNKKLPQEELEYVIISINYNDNLTQDYIKLLITTLIAYNDNLKEDS